MGFLKYLGHHVPEISLRLGEYFSLLCGIEEFLKPRDERSMIGLIVYGSAFAILHSIADDIGADGRRKRRELEDI